jgi:AcrR family transcriptional regulator
MLPKFMASKIRTRIVATAVRCFSKRGYSGTSTKEIATLADVTEGSLFRLFASKENLFTEALALALSAKGIRPMHLRIVAFALLEGKGLTQPNQAAISGLAKRAPLIRELRAI